MVCYCTYFTPPLHTQLPHTSPNTQKMKPCPCTISDENYNITNKSLQATVGLEKWEIVWKYNFVFCISVGLEETALSFCSDSKIFMMYGQKSSRTKPMESHQGGGF